MTLNLFHSTKLGRLGQVLCTFFMLILVLNGSPARADLNKLQRQIKQTQQTKAQQQKQQQQLENKLVKSEQAIAKATLEVNKTQKIISDKRATLSNLQKDTLQLKENKKQQQTILQQQLVSAYMTGQNDLIKLMLNQEDLGKTIRAKSYYHYLNEARLQSIEALHATEQKLINNQIQQAATLKSLEATYQQQKLTQATVRSEQQKRNLTLRKLKKDINYQSTQLAQLASAEKNLRARLKKAAQARQQKELAQAKKRDQRERQIQQQARAQKEAAKKSKLAQQKGKLPWPIRGKVLHSFGSPRSSQVTWKGIAIAANEGEKVRAAATGRVLFAGYFKGYGMVVALDHNDNYITLYGYNQTLLYQAGDVVLQGDTIALAGHSGGQDRNSLYFELSHKGKAQDPIPWLTKRK